MDPSWDNDNSQSISKLLAASYADLLGRKRAHRQDSPNQLVTSSSVMVPADIDHSVDEGQGTRDQPDRLHAQPSTSEPMDVEEIPALPAASSTKEQTARQMASGPKTNFPRFLPRYPLPAIKPEALAAVDEALRDIPVQYILDNILMNLAPAYVHCVFLSSLLMFAYRFH